MRREGFHSRALATRWPNANAAHALVLFGPVERLRIGLFDLFGCYCIAALQRLGRGR